MINKKNKNKISRPGIYLENLHHSFESQNQKVEILKGINFHFQKQKITAIIGRSSSGKTVLLKHLNGLLIPTKGKVIVDDFVFSKKRQKYKDINKLRKNIGFVFQFPEQQLFEETLERDIMFAPSNFKIDKKIARQNMFKYLKLLDLKESHLKVSPFFLSGGQKRKAAIIGILAYEPSYILFDQLASGLDVKVKNDFLKILLKLNKEFDKTIIFTSSNMDDVLKIADQIVVLDDGKIVHDCKPQDLFFDLKLCQKLNIHLPNILSFLKELQIPLSQFKNFNFINDQDLIIDKIVSYFKKIKNKKGNLK